MPAKKKQYLYFFPLHRVYVPTIPNRTSSHWASMWEGMLDENGFLRK